MENKREAYWDNLKLVLIFLVVLGHFLLPVPDKTGIVKAVYYWLYIFHMPAFIFVSGLFSRSYVRKKEKGPRLLGFLAIYVFFTVCIWIIELIFTGQFYYESILSTSGSPWYLLALFFWYLLIPFVSRLRPAVSFLLFIILALAAGMFSECGNFLALSRTIVFFPFFLAGYHFDKTLISKIRPWMRILGALILAAGLLTVLFCRGHVSVFIRFITAKSAYSVIGVSDKQGIIYRFIWYIVAAVMTAALMCIIPDKRFRLTYIGERTLGIYVIHRLLRDILREIGLYKVGNDHTLFYICLAISAVLVIVLSIKPFTTFFNKFFDLKIFFRGGEAE